MKKILTVIGARPQIIKAAAVHRAIQSDFATELTEIVVHTGQHYDYAMSELFFDEMSIPKPQYQFQINSNKQGAQTGKMLADLELVIEQEKPDAVLVYGDTNSTLAGALAASKMFVPLIHIEAGLRSFNKHMPEEINRIVTDHASTLLFSPTLTGVKNLENEGILSLVDAKKKGAAHINNPYVIHSGDVMYDNTLHYSAIANKQSSIFRKNNIQQDNFILATIHRPQNTDNLAVLTELLLALNQIALQDEVDLVLPLHPRTSNILAKNESLALAPLQNNPRLKLLEPVGYLDMLALEQHCKLVITDSGGVQKEAFFMKKPCIVLRNETEWVEIVECGCALLAGSQHAHILTAYNQLIQQSDFQFKPLFGNGKAAQFICKSITEHLRQC